MGKNVGGELFQRLRDLQQDLGFGGEEIPIDVLGPINASPSSLLLLFIMARLARTKRALKILTPK